MRGKNSPYWPKRFSSDKLETPQTNLFHNLENSAKKYPNKTAYIFNNKKITYKNLAIQVEKLAAYLQIKLKVKKTDRILIFTQNSPQFIIALYAINKIGAIAVPANPMNKTNELAHYAIDSGAKIIITTEDVWPAAQPLLEQKIIHWAIIGNYNDNLNEDSIHNNNKINKEPIKINYWKELIAHNLTTIPPLYDSDDPAVIVYTSGTTGKPKGCVHTNASILSGVQNTVCWHGLNQAGISLGTIPMFHVTGMQANINIPIYLGATVVLLQRWNPQYALELIEQYAVSEWTAITTMILDLLKAAETTDIQPSSLQYIRGGGAPMPAAVAQRFQDRFGLTYLEGYGLTETMASVLFSPPNSPKFQCGGIPMFNTSALIIDPVTLTTLSVGEVGEIIISGPQLFKGYWNSEVEDEDIFIKINDEKYIKTGDLGYVDIDGYFFIVDRLKRMINASGFKVWPAEVENILYLHPAVQEACVVASKDPHRGETVKAYIVLKKDHENISKEELITWSKTQMSAYKYPRIIEFREELPRSSSGKILWKEVQELC